MARLKVISEITTRGGPFHCACQLLFDRGPSTWRGFQPVKGWEYFSEGCRGHIDHSDRSPYVNHWVTFEVGSDDILRRADHAAVRDYNVRNDGYAFGNRDCVSFARDFAGYCGLETDFPFEAADFFDPGRLAARHGPDLLPYSLLVKLHQLNRHKVLGDNLM